MKKCGRALPNMNETYIYLFRKLTSSSLWEDKNASRVFIWLLLNVDYKTGSINIGTRELAGKVGLKHSTLRDVLHRLSHATQITHSSPHGLYTTISVLNWAKYQNKEIKPHTSPSESRYSNKEIKNILDKSNMALPPGVGKDGKYGNDQVNLILKRFTDNLGYSPSDRSPRNVAHNIRQLINTFLKNYGASYEVVNGRELTLDYVLDKAWEWYMLKDYASATERLDTFKLKMKTFLELQEKKITKEVIQSDFESERTVLDRQIKEQNSGIRERANSQGMDTFQDVAIIDTTIN